MAEYRLCMKKGSLGYAKNHAAYILREEGYTSKLEQLVYSESGNMNYFDGTSAVKFWEYADTYERANSVVYREMELNIPNEFNHEQAKELISNFVKKELGVNYPYTYAIHESFNKEEEKNLHCHLMFSERENDGIDRKLDKFFKRANTKNPELGGAKKNRKWQEKERLIELRKSWEVEQNTLLEKYGFEERVDCRSLRAIKQELLDKEKYEEAVKFDRTPINISGKILYKVDRKIVLNDKEQEKYDAFLEAKKIRKEKYAKYEFKKTKEDIEKLEKQDSKESAINIVSKGEYFKERRAYFKLLKKVKEYPENNILKDEIDRVSKGIDKIKQEAIISNRFIRIYEQLERNKKRNLQKAKENFKEKYKQEFFNKEQEKIIAKYNNFDILKLKIKEQELLNENTSEKTINIVSDYKYNSYLVDNFNMQKNKNKLEQEYQEASLFNPKDMETVNSKLKGVNKMLENNQNNILILLDNIDKDKIENLSKNIDENKKFELKIIRKKIEEQTLPQTDLEYEKERLFLLEKHASLEKIYSRENENEKKNHKKIYNLSLELSAIENLINDQYNISKDIKNIDELSLNKIEKEVKNKNKRIATAEVVINNTNNIINSRNDKYNLSGIEIITIGKLSKKKYWTLYKEQEKLKAEVMQKEKAVEKMGVIAFGKNVLKKEIEIKKKRINKLEIEEEKIVKECMGNPKFKEECKKTEKYYKNILSKYKQVSYTLKTENKINYKLKSNIKNKDNKDIKLDTKFKKYHKKGRNKDIGTSLEELKRNINKILAADTTEIHSNLDINLDANKDRGYEW